MVIAVCEQFSFDVRGEAVCMFLTIFLLLRIKNKIRERTEKNFKRI